MIQGNDTLVRTRIKNFDLRYEYYPAPGEIQRIGLYKDFYEPDRARCRKFRRRFPVGSVSECGSAYAYGLELEWRKKLEFVDGLSSGTSGKTSACTVTFR